MKFNFKSVTKNVPEKLVGLASITAGAVVSKKFVEPQLAKIKFLQGKESWGKLAIGLIGHGMMGGQKVMSAQGVISNLFLGMTMDGLIGVGRKLLNKKSEVIPQIGDSIDDKIDALLQGVDSYSETNRVSGDELEGFGDMDQVAGVDSYEMSNAVAGMGFEIDGDDEY